MREVILLFLGVLAGWLISHCYYKRALRDYVTAETRREDKESRRRSKNYFEHMLTEAKWEQTYINDLVTWVCPKDVSLKIVVPASTSDFVEPWTKRFPDKCGHRTDVQLKINDSTVEELPFIHLDGGRILVPMPRTTGEAFFWERDSIEFKVGQVIGRYDFHESIERIAEISDISLLRGAPGG